MTVEASEIVHAGTELSNKGRLFSVVIPAHDCEQFVCEALDSVARQTVKGYEIVVVDDGSKDATCKVVEEWAERHGAIPLKLISQANRGPGSARNAGVREAKGEYVAFLDADDLWAERKLEAVETCLNRPAPPDLLCHDEWLEKEGIRKRRLTHGPHASYRDLLFKGNSLSTSATVVRRRALLEAGGFSERFPQWEDYDLWLRLVRAGCRIEYLHEVLGVYRHHARSVTMQAEQYCRCGLDVLDAHFAQWQDQTCYDRLLMRRRRAEAFRSAARALMRQGNHGKAHRFIRLAMSEFPFSWRTLIIGMLNLARVAR